MSNHFEVLYKQEAQQYHPYYYRIAAGLVAVSFALGAAAGAVVSVGLATLSNTAAVKCTEMTTNYTEMTSNYTEMPTNYTEMPTNYTEMPTNCPTVTTDYTELMTKYTKMMTNYTEMMTHCTGLTTSRPVDLPSLRPMILMVGDSMTDQASSLRYRGFQALLSSEYVHLADVINSGRTAWTTRLWLPTVPALVQEWIARPPSLIVIALGTNDARVPNTTKDVPPDEYKANLEAMVDLFHDAFPATKFLLLAPAIADDDIFEGQVYVNARLREYAGYCSEVGRRLGIPVIDFSTLLQGQQKTMLRDGLHLNEAGNQFFCDQILASIASSFPQLTPSALPWRP